MIRKVSISGSRPAYGKDANRLIQACDLGVSGAFAKFSQVATLEMDDSVSKEKIARQLPAIEEAFKAEGCVNLIIKCLGFSKE